MATSNLYIVKIKLALCAVAVKRNLYSVNIGNYAAGMKTRTESKARSPKGRRRSFTAARTAHVKGAARARGEGRSRVSHETTPYHHGALHDALLDAAERLLEREGLAGLTLRAVAREAGVSHAAPAHHFGDLTGLVSELAAIGFRQFNAVMAAADSDGNTLADRAMARARAYVAYAQAHPGMYGLMFRTERLDMTRPALSEAAKASFAGLAGAIGAQRQEQISTDALSLEQAAAIARAWSLVHGFTMLLLDGRLADILKRLPEGTDVATLLDAMLTTSVIRPS